MMNLFKFAVFMLSILTSYSGMCEATIDNGQSAIDGEYLSREEEWERAKCRYQVDGHPDLFGQITSPRDPGNKDICFLYLRLGVIREVTNNSNPAAKIYLNLTRIQYKEPDDRITVCQMFAIKDSFDHIPLEMPKLLKPNGELTEEFRKLEKKVSENVALQCRTFIS